MVPVTPDRLRAHAETLRGILAELPRDGRASLVVESFIRELHDGAFFLEEIEAGRASIARKLVAKILIYLDELTDGIAMQSAVADWLEADAEGGEA